ncbi:MAG: PHP domain-containing protein [Planctomycetota bacterium]|jgi:predicted metal-dependent phosphoesterase TrpH|nr:PHP domain-containing protein [Planctomycetota bacterium]
MPGCESVDLHVHCVFSDGRLAPEALARRAAGNNVVALAITDHDTLGGAREKSAACAENGIECVAGVELSCEYNGREAHLLSLFADPESSWAGRLEEMRLARERRMYEMLERLGSLGVKMTLGDMPLQGGVYGRPHLARALVAKGAVKSVKEAFARYLRDDGPVHVAKKRFAFAEGVDLAKRMGGVAVVAHPGVSGLLDDLGDMVGIGVDGVEAYNPGHGAETVARLLRFARDRNLLVSGGSDFHAPGEGADVGSQRIPPDVIAPLRELAAARRK